MKILVLFWRSIPRLSFPGMLSANWSIEALQRKDEEIAKAESSTRKMPLQLFKALNREVDTRPVRNSRLTRPLSGDTCYWGELRRATLNIGLSQGRVPSVNLKHELWEDVNGCILFVFRPHGDGARSLLSPGAS